MEEIHGHEVLQMMEGHDYTKESLRKAIIDRFGENQLFCTCSVRGLTVDGLIQFLEDRGKFMSTDGGFTVDTSKVCNNH